MLNLNLLTTTIVAPPSNDSKWQMGFNSAFKGLKIHLRNSTGCLLRNKHILTSEPRVIISFANVT